MRKLSVFTASLILIALLSIPSLALGDGPADCDGYLACEAQANGSNPVGGDTQSAGVRRTGGARCEPPTGAGIPSGVDCNGCVWSEKATAAAPNRPVAAEKPADVAEAKWVYVVCFPDGEGNWILTRANQPVPAVPAIVLARRARASFRLPLPAARTSPPGATLVNLPTYLYVDRAGWTPRTATAAVGPTSVTVTATPTQVTWDMGERRSDGGSTVVCEGPGSAYEPGSAVPSCGYTYRRASTSVTGSPALGYLVSAQAVWVITWTCAGVCDQDGGTLEPLTPTSQIRLRVREARSELVAGR